MQKISVIVPVYKAEKFISKCADSIRNQQYANLEIILVDDGSPDLCPKICDEYAKLDNRIKVIHQKNTIKIIQRYENNQQKEQKHKEPTISTARTRNAGSAMEKWEPCYADGWDVNCQQPLWRSVRCVLKHLKNTAWRA